MAKKTGEPGWLWRRSITIVIILFSLAMILFMKDAADTLVNRTIVESVFMLVTVFGLGYTGLATVQDVAAIWRTKSGLPYREDHDHDRLPD